jgi:hypothetical protein
LDHIAPTDRLAMAEWRASRAEHHVARKREIVAGLERAGIDPARSKKLLIAFDKTRMLRIADLDLLKKELGGAMEESAGDAYSRA